MPLISFNGLETPRFCRRWHGGSHWRRRRGSNPRHPAWKAGALPTELLRRVCPGRSSNRVPGLPVFPGCHNKERKMNCSAPPCGAGDPTRTRTGTLRLHSLSSSIELLGLVAGLSRLSAENKGDRVDNETSGGQSRIRTGISPAVLTGVFPVPPICPYRRRWAAHFMF